jgi:hypothetical protein
MASSAGILKVKPFLLENLHVLGFFVKLKEGAMVLLFS